MSETAIFIVGVVIFAITVWGTVMTGGLILTQVEVEQNPNILDDEDDEGDGKTFRLRGRY